ncbi:MAG: RDD family protein [Chloroflexota bacterium]
MSWQSPAGDRPPDPTTPPPDPVAPDPDAQTARFPVDPLASPSRAASPDLTPAPGPAPDPATPTPDTTPIAAPAPLRAGIISANPVGWTGPEADTSKPPADGPAVIWAPPAVPAAPAVGEGLVIARTFPRIVAFFTDSLLLGAIAAGVSGSLDLYGQGRDSTLALGIGIAFVGVDFLYFVGLWTSPMQATLGMRMLRLRVLAAETGATLSVNDAVLRWIALTGAISILTLVPGLASAIGLITILWLLVLVISTATHPLRQGVHDRWARSVVVQPAPGGSGLAIVTCLVLVVLVGVVLPLVVLAVAGDQIREILRQIGESV